MKSIKYLSLCFFLTLLLNGCNLDSPGNLLLNSPKCTILKKSDFDFKGNYFTKMNFTVENKGDGPTAYDVSIHVKIKNDNYIVDESGVTLGTLLNLESRSGDALFSKLKENDKFNNVEITLYWYDSQGHLYK